MQCSYSALWYNEPCRNKTTRVAKCHVLDFSVQFCHLTDIWNVILQGLNHSLPILSPAEALIAIHKIDPERDGVPLKKATILLPMLLIFLNYLFTEYFFLLADHRCMQCLLWAEEYVFSASSGQSPESIGKNIILQVSCNSFITTITSHDFCRSSKFLYPFYSCAQYCKQLVLFLLW